MKKNTRTRRQPQPAQASQAPAGLAHAFRLIAMDGYRPSTASKFADRVHPHAVQIIEYLHGGNDRQHDHANDAQIAAELQAAARTMFQGHEDPTTVPELTAEAGYHVGFAVCWLLMTSIRGQ